MCDTCASHPSVRPKNGFDRNQVDQKDAYRSRPRGTQLRRITSGQKADQEVQRLLKAGQQIAAPRT